jgi:transcriptional regulator with XRE-family HTH domain
MSAESGRGIKLRRVALQLTQRKFATECGVKTWLISALERGEYTPTYEEMRAIGSFLGEQLGGTVRDFFPNYISRDGKNSRPESAPSESAGNRTHNDQT